MRTPEPMRLKAMPARNATTTAAAPTHWRQRSASTARVSAGWRLPMRSSASFARRATKSSTDAPSPTTSAAARLAQARSASLHSARARSDVSMARTAVTSRAFASFIASIGKRRNCTRGAVAPLRTVSGRGARRHRRRSCRSTRARVRRRRRGPIPIRAATATIQRPGLPLSSAASALASVRGNARGDAPASNAITPFAEATGRRAVSCVAYFG